jgi:hypothetical protein
MLPLCLRRWHQLNLPKVFLKIGCKLVVIKVRFGVGFWRIDLEMCCHISRKHGEWGACLRENFLPPFIHVELYFEILDAIDACECFGVGNPKSTWVWVIFVCTMVLASMKIRSKELNLGILFKSKLIKVVTLWYIPMDGSRYLPLFSSCVLVCNFKWKTWKTIFDSSLFLCRMVVVTRLQKKEQFIFCPSPSTTCFLLIGDGFPGARFRVFFS